MEADDSSQAGTLGLIPEAFYDLLAILVPGLVVLCFAYYGPKNPWLPVPATLGEGAVHILAAYLVGHMLSVASIQVVARLANRLHGSPRAMLIEANGRQPILPGARPFRPVLNDAFRHLLRKRMTNLWKLPDDALDGQLCYELCRTYVAARHAERTRFIRKEQAYGELFRSLTLVGVLLVPASIFASCGWIALLGVAMAAGSWIRYLSARFTEATLMYLAFFALTGTENG